MSMKPPLRVLCLNESSTDLARLQATAGNELLFLKADSRDEFMQRLAARDGDLVLVDANLLLDAESPVSLIRQGEVDRLRSLARQLLEAQETERRRLSKQLHDELGQSLSILKMKLQILRQAIPPSESLGFDASIQAADTALQQAREMALRLRPSLLDDLGLASTLHWLAGRARAEAGLEIRATLPERGTRWPAPLETACFRVAQEAIGNVVRHAKATRLDLALIDDGSLTLRVDDDGQGFVAAEAWGRANRGQGLGLLAMEERAAVVGGRFRVETAPGHGTRILAQFPPHRANLPPEGTP